MAQLLRQSDRGGQWKSLPGPRWWAGLVDSVVLGVGPAVVYEQTRRRAEWAGVTARHPVVDVDVIELVLRLDPELAFDACYSRPVLRAATTGLLPEEVRLRRGKSSFDAVFHSLLAGPELASVRAILGAPDAAVAAYVDLPVVRSALLDSTPPDSGRERQRWAVTVWRMLMAELWLRELDSPGGGSELAERVESTRAPVGGFVVRGATSVPGRASDTTSDATRGRAGSKGAEPAVETADAELGAGVRAGD
jgi:hypothetical protein